VSSVEQDGPESNWRLTVFAIDESGRPRPANAMPTAPGVFELLFDPLGGFLFLARDGGIDVYSVDPTTGLLALAQGTTVGNLVSLAVEPRGRFLYISRTDGALWGYSIEPTSGALRDLGRVGDGEGPMVAVSRRPVD
jgi:6-phosphogluconolactonase (cycloisomerase 2 family)